MRRFVQAAAIVAVALFMVVGSASAVTITFNTQTTPDVFVSTGTNTLSGTLNGSATSGSLQFTSEPNVAIGVPPPSGINYGHFILTCTGCSTQAAGTGSITFPSFTFDLYVTDVTDNATGEFVGTGTGGTVWSNADPISITWSPIQLGPFATGALSGNFQGTDFTITSVTIVPAPNSGVGDVTVQGQMNGGTIPEPATFLLLGSALLGFGALRRKRA
jgi:hypothetical protein